MDIELLGYYGSDQIVAQSAWTSTARDLTPEKIERIPKLVTRLWAEGHHTPFEKGVLHFLVRTDIATHIHLLKHRIGVSVNGESARYKELIEDLYHLPGDWDEEFTDGALKPEDYTWKQRLDNFSKLANTMYHYCLRDLTPVLGRKRAKESARFFKLYNTEIQADVMFNLRSFGHFLKLRNSPHAQKEVRELAQGMLALAEGIEGNPFKTSLWVIQRSNALQEEAQNKITLQLLEELE